MCLWGRDMKLGECQRLISKFEDKRVFKESRERLWSGNGRYLV